ncbi:MAG: response regulator [bacterium]|nr:response regulator [bacterium]
MAANKGSILIVDDSPTVRAIFQDYLESAGYRVREAENGHQGLDLLREHSFDLVLSDMEMPEMDGLAFLKALRETYSLTELPVIMVTSHDDTEEIVGALDIGANDYVTKSAALPVLLARIRNQLSIKWLEERARCAAREAEAANQAKSAFLSHMSHELRTPLNAILGFTQLMRRDSKLTSEHQEYLEVIGRSGEHLLALINDVLDMAKIEAGQVVLNEADFDLYGLLDTLKEMFHLQARDKGLELVFERAQDVPRYVFAEEGRLRQVLINLLSNAIKFTEAGWVALRVRSRDTSSEHGLFFEVEDTGPGVATEDQAVLFDPFVQTAAGQRSQEGTGLGLPISQAYVQMMGGEIQVESEGGRGATFRFEIRIEGGEVAAIQTSHRSHRPLGLEPGEPKYRILVVEDQQEGRKLLCKMLAPMGFEIREAADGQEGLKVWEMWAPHLIWMDMQMPVMDGYEATRRIKATTKGQDTVVIALTASAFEENRTQALLSGCNDFVRKPFREEEIFDAMAKHLGVRFVYEAESRPAALEAEMPGTLTPEALSVVPIDRIRALYQAVVRADQELVFDLLSQIEVEHADLARALKDLVHDFRFDEIIQLIQAVGGADLEDDV